jgi:hypothetical protein
MHFDRSNNKFIIAPPAGQPLQFSLSHEIADLLNETSRGDRIRVDLRVDAAHRNTAIDQLRTTLAYYGHTMKTVGGSEIEIEVM